MNIEIKIEVENGGSPVEVEERYEINFELDAKYKASVFRTVNGVVKHRCDNIRIEVQDGEYVSVTEGTDRCNWIKATIENIVNKNGIGAAKKVEAQD
jgi:hypothetical protein